MEKFIDIIKNKMNKKYVYIILILGVTLMVISGLGGENKPETEISANYSDTSQINELEKRLENILSKIEGVGTVNVMITYESTSEKIAVSNEKISNKDDSESVEKEIVMQNNGSQKEPFISKEIKPVVRGVLVVAQGAENSSVRINLIRAVTSLLDVTVNRVEVLPKNMEGKR